MTRPHRCVVLLALVIASGLSACSQTPPSLTATVRATSIVTVPVTTTPPTGCRSGVAVLRIAAGPTPAPLCLRLGTTIQFTADSSPRQPWQPLETSNSDVLRCQSYPTAEGSIAGSCLALTVGSATLRTGTAPDSGDPHGPPQVFWDLTVTATP